MLTDEQRAALGAQGFVKVPQVIEPEVAGSLRALFTDDGLFHKTVKMEEKGYGKGRYRYFKRNHLPKLVATLRDRLYEDTLPMARAWQQALETEPRFPDKHFIFDELCCAEGQTESACLLLEYPEGGYNELHQDLYGKREIIFPYQLVMMLSPHSEYEGGDFLVEKKSANGQVAALQSISLEQGDGVIVSTRWHVNEHGEKEEIRHGVDKITRGTRATLGVIAHNWGP